MTVSDKVASKVGARSNAVKQAPGKWAEKLLPPMPVARRKQQK